MQDVLLNCQIIGNWLGGSYARLSGQIELDIIDDNGKVCITTGPQQIDVNWRSSGKTTMFRQQGTTKAKLTDIYPVAFRVKMQYMTLDSGGSLPNANAVFSSTMLFGVVHAAGNTSHRSIEPTSSTQKFELNNGSLQTISLPFANGSVNMNAYSGIRQIVLICNFNVVP